MAGNRIRVLLVDDHEMVRNGVRLMLGTADGIEVCGEAANAHEGLRLAREQDFDVALVDVALPDKNGLELLRSLRAEKPRLAVLILSTYSEDIYAVRALKLGASGYLNKDCPTATLIAAVRKAASGGRYFSPALLEKLADIVGGNNAGQSHESLSNRELEVFKLIAAGESLVNIGNQLHLSPNTVTTYRSRILDKMGLSSNAELTRYAIENDLI